MKIINFRGQNVELVIGKRFKTKDPDKCYYSIRHDDCNSNIPCTIEPTVRVNHYGDICSQEHILEEGCEYIDLIETGEFELFINKKHFFEVMYKLK